MSARRRRGLRSGLGLTAVAAAVALLSAACSSSSSGSGAQTLKIITWVNPPAVTAFKTIDAEFHKKYPNITVDLQTAANVNGPYLTLQETTVDSSTADIITNVAPLQAMPLKPTRQNMSTWQFWSTSNVFLPLNGQSFLSDYSKSALAAETYNGKTYGLVSGAYQEGVFYNKQIFAKYHLTPPTTYTQFMSEMATLKSHGVTPLFVGLGDVGPVYLQFLYYELMASVWYPSAPGGNLATAIEKGTVKWTAPQFTTAMTEEKAIAKYLEPGYTGVPWESMPGDFAKGDSAMLLDGSWDLAAIHQANPKIQVGFFPVPGSNTPADNQGDLDDNLTISVLKNAPDSAAALKWLAFFSQPSVYEQYVDITGISPSENGGTYNSFAATSLGSLFGKGLNQNVFYPVLSPQQAYWDQPANWPTLQQDVINGTKTPAQAEALYQGDWKTS